MARRSALLRLLRGARGAPDRTWQPWSRFFASDAAERLVDPPPAGEPLAVPTIHVSYTCEEADAHCDALRASGAAGEAGVSQLGGCLALGFDIEIRPMFTRQYTGRRRAALVQLASGEACVLVHVASMAAFPQRVAALVEDPSVWKVGTGVAQDLEHLREDFNLRPASFVDLAVVGGLYRYARVGLKGLAASFGVEVAKTKAVQLSNWEAAPLRRQQVEYAAQDAALGLWLLRRLHGAHGGGVALADWAAAFLNVRSVGELLAAPATRHGPLAADAAAHGAARAAEAAARAALAANKRCRQALAAGLADPAHALGALNGVAHARGLHLAWELAQEAPQQPGAEPRFVARCAMEGRPLGAAAGRSRALAKRAAALQALHCLAAEAV